MLLEIKDLAIPVWIYDIDNYCIQWANQPALALWESDSPEELYSRDFKLVTSKAVESRLLEYRRAFKKIMLYFMKIGILYRRVFQNSYFASFHGTFLKTMDA